MESRSPIHGIIGKEQSKKILVSSIRKLIDDGVAPGHVFLIRESSTGPALTVDIARHNQQQNKISFNCYRMVLTIHDEWKIDNGSSDDVQKKFKENQYQAVQPNSEYLKANPNIIESFMTTLSDTLHVDLNKIQWSTKTKDAYSGYGDALSQIENRYADSSALTSSSFFAAQQRQRDNEARARQEQDDREAADRLNRELNQGNSRH